MKTRQIDSDNMEDSLESNPLEESDDFFEDVDDTSDLPMSLIVTNVDISVYTDSEQRTQFEDLFRRFDSAASFHYLKSFRRVRVIFESPDAAAQARIQCHQMKFGESVLNCYFAQASSPDGESKDGAHLQPPLPQRQFLISPPASPPVGWAPSEEAQPCISYDIITALASLTPGETHELHPATESQPGIVVHVCEETSPSKGKPKVLHTRRPDLPGNGNNSPPSAAAES